MQPAVAFFFFVSDLSVEVEKQWRRKRQRDRETCNGGFFFFFFLGETMKKKIRERCILFCVFLSLEIGMECNK